MIYKRVYLKIPTWERLNRLKNAFQDMDQLINDIIDRDDSLFEEIERLTTSWDIEKADLIEKMGIEELKIEGLRMQIRLLKGEPN